MGAFLDKPKIEKQNEKGSGNNLEYAVSSMQGWRVDMEDSHTAELTLPGLQKWSFFAVFDGHAGAKVAEHASKNLLQVILAHETFKKLIDSKDAVEKVEDIKSAIQESFLSLDADMRVNINSKNGVDRSGSTSVCVLMSPTRYYFINCGDSRAFLCRQGKVQFATLDHKPNNPPEKDRIQKAGGSVMIQRVNGSLAVSRALGDYEYKNVENMGQTEQLVSPLPEVDAVDRIPKEDEFVVLACDGIFDVSTNVELCDYLCSRLQLTENLTDICNDVVDMSLNKGSRDNMTLVILGLPSIKKPTEKAKEAEEKLNTDLTNLMKEICTELKTNRGDDDIDFAYVMQTLMGQEEKITGLPPGGGINSKRAFLEKVYNDIFPDDAMNGGSIGNEIELSSYSEQPPQQDTSME